MDTALDNRVLGLVCNDCLVVEWLVEDFCSVSLDFGILASRCEWVGGDNEFLDLFKRKTLGFVHNKVGEDAGKETSTCPDPEYLGMKASLARTAVNEVGSGVTNSEVPQPVGCGTETQSLCTDVEREVLATDDPGGRSPAKENIKKVSFDGENGKVDGRDNSPSGGEAGNVDADESHESLLGRWVGVTVGSTDGRDDQLADGHVHGTPDQESSSTESVHHPEGRNGADDVDNIRCNGEEEWVASASRLEEGGTVL